MSDPGKRIGNNPPGINITGVQGSHDQARQKREKESGQPESWRMGLTPQILASSSLSDEVTEQAWLAQLKTDSSDFIANRSGKSQNKLAQDAIDRQGIEVIIDRLFSCMQGYMYEFNKVAVGTDLHVSGTISGEVTEITRTNKYREAEVTETYFRARLSTRIFSLILRGRENKIDFFLLPVTRAMALSTIESEYPSLATIEIKVRDDGIMWRPLKVDPSCHSLESLCGWAFKQLVEETRTAITGESQ
jgi:hypothetical protein